MTDGSSSYRPTADCHANSRFPCSRSWARNERQQQPRAWGGSVPKKKKKKKKKTNNSFLLSRKLSSAQSPGARAESSPSRHIMIWSLATGPSHFLLSLLLLHHPRESHEQTPHRFCKGNHRVCNQLRQSIPEGFRVLDCSTRAILEWNEVADPHSHYVALSYV